ncbi:MMPL family transporter [Aestuariimicrobium ganziense]|uniref:MMPL family transporter n=1 Tax=Aestuariimicrobium ganziense TaxID=2773677 RepID=UPI001944C032|nr:MMPL family transporter [Aestuariimicrobium ganziense]
MDALTRLITARRTGWIFGVGGVLLFLVLIGMVGPFKPDAAPTDSLPVGKGSTIATEWSSELPQEEGAAAVVLFTADQGVLSQEHLGALMKLMTEVKGDQAAPPAQGGPPPVIPSEDGTAALGTVLIESNSLLDNNEQVKTLRADLKERAPDGVTVQVTGPAAVQADLSAVFDGANIRLLAATATVVAILLIVTYRSPFLWLIPLTVVGVADQGAAVIATHVLKWAGVPFDDSTTGILSVLVFGAGTNYSLLLISRYRDELRSTEDRHLALQQALRQTIEPVFASATTVVVGVLTLLLSLTPSLRGLGLACAVGIAIAMVGALVVLPGALSMFGRWIFWPSTPKVGQATLAESRSMWRRVGDTVAKRPPLWVAVALGVIAALAIGLTQVKLGLPQEEQFLTKPEAIAASERLAESFPAGSADPVQVLTKDDPAEVKAAIEGVDGLSQVAQTNQANGITEFRAVLSSDPDTAEARDTVTALRTALADHDQTHVGGTTARAIDEADATARDRMLIIPLILLLVMVALVVLLRSLLAPVLLVLTVVGTFLASMGASWWIFTGLFGFSALDSTVPVLSFLFLVALGVDYNIFLVTRAKEEAATHGVREGMLRGLGATGGVITSAGILLAAVFAVLGVLPLVVLAQIGAIICLGVLLDTLLVRTILVPALSLTIGEKFWWPRRIGPKDEAAGVTADATA